MLCRISGNLFVSRRILSIQIHREHITLRQAANSKLHSKYPVALWWLSFWHLNWSVDLSAGKKYTSLAPLSGRRFVEAASPVEPASMTMALRQANALCFCVI